MSSLSFEISDWDDDYWYWDDQMFDNEPVSASDDYSNPGDYGYLGDEYDYDWYDDFDAAMGWLDGFLDDEEALIDQKHLLPEKREKVRKLQRRQDKRDDAPLPEDPDHTTTFGRYLERERIRKLTHRQRTRRRIQQERQNERFRLIDQAFSQSSAA